MYITTDQSSNWCLIVCVLNFRCHLLSVYNCLQYLVAITCTMYSKTPLLRPPLGLRKNGLSSGMVLLLR